MFDKEFDRVIYKQNPLIEVVSQLRFPPILKISNQDPTDFQEEIRNLYPLFQKNEFKLPQEVLNLVEQTNLNIAEISYSFKSEDQKWHLSLTKDLIAITTSSYEEYGEFRERFLRAVEIFERIYKPSFYTRVGLRYKDLIIRSTLGFDKDTTWAELIEKNIASELHDPKISSLIQTITKNLILEIEGNQVNLNHGLVNAKDPSRNIDETAYLFDADFYVEQKIEEKENVWNLLDQFNKSAGKLFRNSITTRLHEAMHPQPI